MEYSLTKINNNLYGGNNIIDIGLGINIDLKYISRIIKINKNTYNFFLLKKFILKLIVEQKIYDKITKTYQFRIIFNNPIGLNEQNFNDSVKLFSNNSRIMITLVKNIQLDNLINFLETNIETVMHYTFEQLKELKYFPSNYEDDIDLILDLILINYNFFKFASEHIKKNKEKILQAAKINYDIVNHIDKELKNDFELFYELIKIEPKIFQYASENIKKNKQYIYEFIKLNINIYYLLDESIKIDKEFNLSLIDIDPNIFKYFESFKLDLKFIEECCYKNIKICKYIDDSLKDNFDFIKNLLKINPEIFLYLPENPIKIKEFLIENHELLYTFIRIENIFIQKFIFLKDCLKYLKKENIVYAQYLLTNIDSDVIYFFNLLDSMSIMDPGNLNILIFVDDNLKNLYSFSDRIIQNLKKKTDKIEEDKYREHLIQFQELEKEIDESNIEEIAKLKSKKNLLQVHINRIKIERQERFQFYLKKIISLCDNSKMIFHIIIIVPNLNIGINNIKRQYLTKEIIIEILKKNIIQIKNIGQFNEDSDICILIFKKEKEENRNYNYLYQDISPKLRNDPDFVRLATDNNPKFIFSSNLQHNKDYLSDLVKHNHKILGILNEEQKILLGIL